MTILPNLSDLVIEQVSITTEVTVTVRAASPTASCPCCGTISKWVQSRYTRTLRDLPASGRLVHLVVRVRRFFCQESTCVRKIFAERFPALTLPRVKFTLRLQETLGEMGFALGGEAGARLGKYLSIPGSSDTILRLVKQSQLPAASSPHIVGIDDWSWKRRLRYGTLICDLASNKPIDVLPDRSVETVSFWFENHPTVEIVSRDRSSEYAAAIKKGAPQALQVADRWHIGKNLADSVETLLARCRAEIRRGLQQVQAMPEQERGEAEPVPEEERRPLRSRSVEVAREGRRAQKLDRYTQVVELHQQGLRAADIASRVGIGERTVHRWLHNGSCPEARRRRRRPSLIDPYERYVLTWWQEGNRKGLQLYRELTSRGDIGSSKAMYNYLATLRTPQSHSSRSSPSKPQGRKSISSSPAPLENFSAQRATRLFVGHPEKLDEMSREELALIRQASPSAEAAYGLAQAFMQMIREQTGQQLDTWLSEVEASHLPELESFAKGIQQDKAAVLAELTLPWSTGPVEGHVNRLKLLKRSMYGRAKLPLLRARVLACWPRRRLLAQPFWLDSDIPTVAQRAGAGTEQADWERRNHPRRTKGRRTMRMSFDINEAVFDERGTYLEEKAVRYEHALMEQFAASPEGQAITQTGTELGWAGAMIHYAITYPGATPPTMTTSDLEEVVFGLFPRKVITERGDGVEIIQELRAFWHFLQRVYQLPQTKQMLAHLTPQATRRLERELQEPANFGMAKSFVLMGKEAGFDMESPEGMQAWVKAYNATVAPVMAATDPASKKKSRGAPTGIRSAQRRKRKPTHPHERREP